MQGKQSDTTGNQGDAGDDGGDTPEAGGVYGFSVGGHDDSDEAKSPCTKAGTAVGLGQTPSRDACLAISNLSFLFMPLAPAPTGGEWRSRR